MRGEPPRIANAEPILQLVHGAVELVLGEGGLTPHHGGVLLPDAVRWVFRPADAEPPAEEGGSGSLSPPTG